MVARVSLYWSNTACLVPVWTSNYWSTRKTYKVKVSVSWWLSLQKLLLGFPWSSTAASRKADTPYMYARALCRGGGRACPFQGVMMPSATLKAGAINFSDRVETNGIGLQNATWKCQKKFQRHCPGTRERGSSLSVSICRERCWVGNSIHV